MAAPCTILVLLCLIVLASTFVLSLDILPGDVNKPYKVDPVQVLNEIEGKNLHITCTCKCSSCVELHFLFNSSLIAYFRRSRNQMRNRTLPDYKDRVQVYHDNDNYTVVISNLTIQDEGEYFCRSAAYSQLLHVNIKEVEDSDYGVTRKEPFTSENMTGNSMEHSGTIQPIEFPKRQYDHTAASPSSVDDLTNDKTTAEAGSPTTHASTTPPSASAKRPTVEGMSDHGAEDSQASLSVTSASLRTTIDEDVIDLDTEDSQASLSLTSTSLKTKTVEDMSDHGAEDSKANLSLTSTSLKTKTVEGMSYHGAEDSQASLSLTSTSLKTKTVEDMSDHDAEASQASLSLTSTSLKTKTVEDMSYHGAEDSQASQSLTSTLLKTKTVEDMSDHDAEDSQASQSLTSTSLKTKTVEDTSYHGAEDSQASLSLTSTSLKTTTVEDMSDHGAEDFQASLSLTSTSLKTKTVEDMSYHGAEDSQAASLSLTSTSLKTTTVEDMSDHDAEDSQASLSLTSTPLKTKTVEDMSYHGAENSQASLSVTSASLRTTIDEDVSDHDAEDSQASLSVTSASLKITTVEDMSDHGAEDPQASLSVTSTSYRSRKRLDQNRNPTPSPPLHSSSPPESETDYSRMRPDDSSPKIDHHVRATSLSVAFTSSSSDFGSGESGDASPISPEFLNPSSSSTETEFGSGDLDDELTSTIPSGSTSNDKHISSASSNRTMTQNDLQDITSQARDSKIPTNSSQKYVFTTDMSTPKVFKNHEVEDSPATPSSKLESTRGKDVAPVDEVGVNKESSQVTTDSQVPNDSPKKKLLKPSTSLSRGFNNSENAKDSTSPSPSKQEPKAGTDGVVVDKDKSDEEATPVTSSIETEVIGYVGVIIAGTITMMLIISLLVIKLWLKQHEEYV